MSFQNESGASGGVLACKMSWCYEIAAKCHVGVMANMENSNTEKTTEEMH